MIVVADTSGLVAAFNPADPEHTEARTALNDAGAVVVTPLVMLEVEHVLTRAATRTAALGVNDWMLRSAATTRLVVAAVDADVLRTARQVQDRYAALDLDLADAVTVVVADRYATDVVLTLDRRDFRAVTPLGGGAFRLLPDDR